MDISRIIVSIDEPIARIAPALYGHFAEHLGLCVEEGLWVGPESKIPNTDGIRNDVVAALRKVRIPVLRWPGGCFADDYHWQDGVGPRQNRPRTVNIHWGHVIEDNSFGTHEFIQLCRLLGAEPYLAGNLGSGSPSEMRNWVEYCNFPGDSTLAKQRAANGSPEPFGVKYFGVGNENWGCGGNMTPEDYAAAYKQYSTYLRDFGGNKLFLVACGPNGNDGNWTRKFFTELGTYRRIHGLGAHYYVWNADGRLGRATDFTTDQYYQLLKETLVIEEVIVQQRAIMDGFDPQRRIGLFVDEWGAWHPEEKSRDRQILYQQNTMRDALVAGLTLNLFNRHADKLVMCNIAQICNVIQSLILTDGPRMLTTPTYHVFKMFQSHQGATAVRCRAESSDVGYTWNNSSQQLPRLSVSASVLDGTLTMTIVNTDATNAAEVELKLLGGGCHQATIDTLSHPNVRAHNTFDQPELVSPSHRAIEIGTTWRQMFPPASVSVIHAKIG